MIEKKILVPVDFTELSGKVIKQAAMISIRTGMGMQLLHVVKHDQEKAEALIRLSNLSDDCVSVHSVSCGSKVRTGSIFTEIPGESASPEYAMMIIGTHGIKGLKQKLMGADILKIVSKTAVPSLVVQASTHLKQDFGKITLPVASHESYARLVETVGYLATSFGSQVDLFSIEKPGYEWPESILKNIDMARNYLEEKSVQVIRTKEKQTVLSVGYARQTLQHAENSGSDLIAVMALASEEYHYFAQQDKENLVNNEQGIPVLFASGAKQSL